MDLTVIICVCLLLLLPNVALFSATHLLCLGVKCIIKDVKAAEDFFVLQYIKKHVKFIVFANVQMKHLDTSLLNRVGDITRTITVEQSDALSWLSISTASTIGMLHIRSTGLKSIHFEPNHHLRLLAVAYSNVGSIPTTIQKGTGLESLEISNSAIRMLDFALFCDLPLLKRLNLAANKIRIVVNSCPRVCKVYDSLETVNLSNNLLKTVSMILFQPFVRLCMLQLNRNLIRTLTGCLASDMLQELGVSDNKLKSFSLCQWRIPFLIELTLESNQLTVLPACLDNLKSLKKLVLDKNRISAIEFSDIGWMDNLEEIYLDHNRIRSITLISSDFPMRLKRLSVNHNNITELKLWFVPVKALEVNAAHNLISSFDINATSNHIRELHMQGNPMDCSWRNPQERMCSKCYLTT